MRPLTTGIIRERKIGRWKKERGGRNIERQVQKRKIKNCLLRKKQNEKRWCYSYLSGYDRALISPEVRGLTPNEAAHKNNVSTPSVVRLSG